MTTHSDGMSPQKPVSQSLLDASAALSAAKRILAAVGKVYVADLASYNAGKLRGGWIVPDSDSDILESQIRDALRADKDQDVEWAIHDYDGFPNIGENPSIDQLAGVAALLEDHDAEVVEAALEQADRDVSRAEDFLADGYGIYSDGEDYAASVVDDMGGPAKLGDETLSAYFDFERYGRDLLLEINNARLKDGRLLVFNKND